MSVSAVSSSDPVVSHSLTTRTQQFREDFQQLGRDLKSGNLPAARADFASLQELKGPGGPSPTQHSFSPLRQAFAQMSQDLNAGDLSAARHDYSNIRQAFQNRAEGQPSQTVLPTTGLSVTA